MGDLGNAIKYLYEKFILRDILSFITPGAIVVAAVLLLWLCPSQILYYLSKIHWLLYIAIFGFLFMVGYAIQCFGAMCFPKAFKRVWDREKLKTIYKTKHKVQSTDERSRQEYERIVVLKQMAQNGFLAGIIAIIFLGIYFGFGEQHSIPSCWRLGATGVLAVVLLVSLYCDYRHSVLAESVWEKVVLEEKPKRKD